MSHYIKDSSGLSDDDKELLRSAGFKEESGKWLVPSELNVAEEMIHFDLFETHVWYGETELLAVPRKTAFYDRRSDILLNRKALRAYVAGELSAERGEKYAAMLVRCKGASVEETERQRKLASSNPNAYRNEGLMAVLNLLTSDDE